MWKFVICMNKLTNWDLEFLPLTKADFDIAIKESPQVWGVNIGFHLSLVAADQTQNFSRNKWKQGTPQ